MFRYLFASVLLLFGCEQQVPPRAPLDTVEPVASEAVISTRQLNAALKHIAQQALSESLEEASHLDAAIQTLLRQPTVKHLALAREHWQTSLEAFYRAQPFLLFHNSKTPANKHTTLAHWPFYPGFIDSYDQYRGSGLVNSIDTPLNLSAVRQYHQQYEVDELLLGFYPMAYLLWNENETRPADDFIAINTVPPAFSSKPMALEQLVQNRRRQLLRLQSEWLLMDVETLYDAWMITTGNPSLLPDQRLRMITDSLLLSLKSMILQLDAGHGLPDQWVQRHQAGMYIVLSNIQQYYFDSGLAAYWLVAEKRLLAQAMLSELQQHTISIESEKLQTLLELLSPDTLQKTAIQAVLK